MDEELQLLEAELKRLRPRAPSAELHARVEVALAPRRRPGVVLRFAWVAAPLAAAAGVAVLLAFRTTAPTETVVARPVVTAAQFKPVAARNLLLESRDEGLVTLADGTTARRTSESYLATITWKNPRTNASLTWSVPREEVRVVPVSYQ